MGGLIFIGVVGALMVLFGVGVWGQSKSAIHEIEAMIAIGLGLLLIATMLSTWVIQGAIKQVGLLIAETSPKGVLSDLRKDLASARVAGTNHQAPPDTTPDARHNTGARPTLSDWGKPLNG